MKTIQHFTSEYLKQCADMKPDQIARFLEDFRVIYGSRAGGPSQVREPSKLISLKVSPDLLRAFRARCGMENIRYQTQIKTLMENWLLLR
ncbi:MAG: BrnA antitoxin family protein [Deltaproteobacteria bacterium]|nr:BrnA antitoxin family protein [Deltaproteobacteria bacterium]MBI3294655.1 BrnA antitoxin family protein [Deltaproteobacteria bacterium]